MILKASEVIVNLPPVIVMTGAIMGDVSPGCEIDKFVKVYLKKPFEYSELSQKILDVFEK
jgi:hypothetical protein